MQPVILVLNGASSAGKTTTAHALLARLGANCLNTGFDDILDRVQPFGNETTNALTRMIRVAVFNLTDGRLKLFQQLHREIVAASRQGQNVIVETALMDERALRDAATAFSSLNAYFIGMKPPLDVSEAWKAKRTDRPQGHARRHYDLIHAHGIYDLVVDPSHMTPDACAQVILKRIEEPPGAFGKLAVRA